MAFVLKDRVKESTTTTGTGSVTLAGASTGFQSFSAIGDGNSTYYAIALAGGNEWEVGIGTYTASGTTLSRDTVLSSSNSGSLVNFSAGVKDVFVTQPADRAIYTDWTGTLPNSNTTATSANTASAIVARDGSGNFSAGTITATLNGNASSATTVSATGATNLYSPNGTTVITTPDSVMPSEGGSLIHSLAYGPSSNDGHILAMSWTGTSVYGAQIWLDTDPTNRMAIRSRSGAGVWNGWSEVLTDNNYTSYSPSLTGSGASGTWGISISGSAPWGSVTGRPGWLSGGSYIETLSDANSWANSGFYENGGGGSNWPSYTWYNSINVRHSNQGNYHGFQIAMSYYDNNLWFRSYQGYGTFQSWAYAISSTNNTSLNSDSRNTRGVTRLYRRDDNSDYSVQTYWTGSYWRLYGYSGDSGHADTYCGYSDNTGALQGYAWMSYGKDLRASEHYADGWFRNYNSGQGLYNQSTGNHFYSDGNYWNVAYGGTNGIRMRNGYGGTILGYLYAETNQHMGLLNSYGNWAVQVYPGGTGGGYLHGSWSGSSITANQLSTASGSAPSYAVRAWVNFNGQTNSGGYCSIRGSGNVSSVTDNGVGDYTVYFSTGMPDGNYAVALSSYYTSARESERHVGVYAYSYVQVLTGYSHVSPGASDPSSVFVTITR